MIHRRATQPSLLAAALVAWTLFSPASALADLRVVTTTTDLADFVRAIGGEDVQVTAICSGTQDPHYVRARPSYMVRVSRADLLVAVGLELEVGWLPALIQGARNPRVNPGHPGYLEASAAITPIDVPTGELDRSRGDIHPQGNPHYWLDPLNAKRVVALIASRMADLDPDHAATFRQNERAWSRRMDRAIVRWRRAMAPFRGTKVVSYHRTFNYFHRRFGLVGAGYVEERPGIPPSPSHLARLIVRMRREHIGAIFQEGFYDHATSSLVAARTGATVLVLPTSVGGTQAATSYERLIDHIVSTVVQALASRSQ